MHRIELTTGTEIHSQETRKSSIELAEELDSPGSDNRFSGHGDHLPLEAGHGSNDRYSVSERERESWHVGAVGGIVQDVTSCLGRF